MLCEILLFYNAIGTLKTTQNALAEKKYFMFYDILRDSSEERHFIIILNLVNSLKKNETTEVHIL